MLFTDFERRAIFLETVFLWYTPLLPAFVISTIAALRAVLAASTSFCATAASTFLIAVLTLDLIALFLAAFVSLTKIQADDKSPLYLSTLDSDTDVLMEHTRLFYANRKNLSIHNLKNTVKNTSRKKEKRKN